MKKLVIFDLDGTLLNTIADLAQSTNHALSVLGYPHCRFGAKHQPCIERTWLPHTRGISL